MMGGSDWDGARIEVEGLASALETLSVYVYENHPEARAFVAENIALFDENGNKVWERREENLPPRLSEKKAKAAIDRLRIIWRDGSFENDPLSR